MAQETSPSLLARELRHTSAAHAPTEAERPRWERIAELVVDHIAYVLLAVSYILVMTDTSLTAAHRAVIPALVVAAVIWIRLMYFGRVTCGDRGEHPVAAAVYFAGFLVLAFVLMQQNQIFLVFLIAGFFHAEVLRPWPVTFLGVGLVSLLLNTLTLLADVSPLEDPGTLVFAAVIFVIQTVSIGGGMLVGQRVMELSETRRQMVADLETALQENAGLHAQLVTQAREAGVLDERQRLAREIHDTLAQGLTGIIAQLEAASRAKERPAARDKHIETAARLARESLTEARRSVQALHPEPLENARLPAALADVGERWSTVSGVNAQVTATGTTRPLHPAIEVTLLRVTQEALANVAKHAAASRAVVTLSYMDDVVTLDVRDDGVGFAADAGAVRRNGDAPAVSGYGLTAMRQRVDEYGGTFSVESEPGRGSCVSVSVPAIPPGATDG
jgi:signal transduction histidine kinase